MHSCKHGCNLFRTSQLKIKNSLNIDGGIIFVLPESCVFMRVPIVNDWINIKMTPTLRVHWYTLTTGRSWSCSASARSAEESCRSSVLRLVNSRTFRYQRFKDVSDIEFVYMLCSSLFFLYLVAQQVGGLQSVHLNSNAYRKPFPASSLMPLMRHSIRSFVCSWHVGFVSRVQTLLPYGSFSYFQCSSSGKWWSENIDIMLRYFVSCPEGTT